MLDWADPWIPCRRRGKWLRHGGDVCGIVVLVVNDTFRTIPTIGKLRSKIFLHSYRNPYRGYPIKRRMELGGMGFVLARFHILNSLKLRLLPKN